MIFLYSCTFKAYISYTRTSYRIHTAKFQLFYFNISMLGGLYMRIQYKCQDGHLEMLFYPNEDEGIFINKEKTKTILMNNHSCKFILPKDWTLDHVHPDILALATILIIYPFSKKHIELSIGVSSYFADICKKIIKKEISPVDTHLSPRVASHDAKMALAYSGGVDSTAALLLLPDNTSLFFVDRIIPDHLTSVYNKESAYYAYDTLKNEGRSIYIAATNFEYVRNPVGFPVDLACCIPALLLSDYDNIDSIATGMILESAYGIGHENFKDYPSTWHYSVWGTLFKAVDLPLSLVTSGLSEVTTSHIVSHSKYANIAQSCMRAKDKKPCMKCPKCIRKIMLDQTLAYGQIDDKLLQHFFSLSFAPDFFASGTMHHQDVMTYITSHYHGNYEPMLLFKRRMGGDIMNVDFLERWYSPSLAVVKEKYHDFVKKRILTYIEPMTPGECQEVASWDLSDFLQSDDYKNTTEHLYKLLMSSKLKS